MNLTALQARCTDRFRDPSHDILSNAQWLDYLNDAYADVQAATPFWPWFATSDATLTVAANARTTALPVNVFGVTAVLNDTDDIRMRPFNAGTSETYAEYPTDTDSGPPLQYRVLGTTLYVYPKPTVTTALRVEYTKPAAELATGSDLPAFPAQFHRILVEGALARAYTDDANLKQAQAHEEAFAAILGDLKDAMLQPQEESYPEIVDNFWPV